MKDGESEWLIEESTRRMREGIRLLEASCFEEAGGHFAAAAELRQRMPWREDVESAWSLAAAWINLSDALSRRNCQALLPEAIACLDRGIEAMRYVPLEANPAFPERLLLAWIQRASLCGEMRDPEAAAQGFEKAERLFAQWGEEVSASRIFLRAMMLGNRARFLSAMGQGEPAWRDARQAVALLDSLEPNAGVVIAALKARGALCLALAAMVDDPRMLEQMGDWIAEATDAVEESLVLVKRSGVNEPWIGELVRYGAKIYRVCQPQFLGAFLVDWLGRDGPLAWDHELRREMRNELLLARAEVERKVLLIPHDTEFVERQTRVLAAIQAGEQALSL